MSCKYCRTSIRCPIHYKLGKGIPYFNLKWLQGPRKGSTKRFKEFLDKEGSQKITDIRIARKPVEKGVKLAMNLLSGGRFGAKAKELGYDDVYHQYLIVTLADGNSYVVHKNEIVEHRTATKADFDNENYSIPLPKDREYNLKDMINKAALEDKGKPASEASQRRFWQYNSDSDNCQIFTKSVIEDNGLTLTDEKAKQLLVPQDGVALVSTLGELSYIPKLVTDTAATLDRFRYGDGIKRGAGGFRSVEMPTIVIPTNRMTRH